jgi:hypothetical protein
MKFIIQRPIDGISINGRETAVDENNNVLFFDTVQEALDFLYDGEDKDMINQALDSGELEINGYEG